METTILTIVEARIFNNDAVNALEACIALDDATFFTIRNRLYAHVSSFMATWNVLAQDWQYTTRASQVDLVVK